MAAPKRTKKGTPKLASELTQEYLDSLAKSKAEAWKMDTNIYFDGTECLEGHIAVRARSSGRCAHCNDISRKKRISSSKSTVGLKPKTFYIPFINQSVQLLSANMN